MEKLVEYLDAISFRNIDFDSFCAWRYQEEVEEKFDEIAKKVEMIKSEKDILEEEGDNFEWKSSGKSMKRQIMENSQKIYKKAGHLCNG